MACSGVENFLGLELRKLCIEFKDSSALPTKLKSPRKTNIIIFFIPSTTSITQRASIIDEHSLVT